MRALRRLGMNGFGALLLILALSACATQQGPLRIAGAYDMTGVVTDTNSTVFEVGDEDKTNITVFTQGADVEVLFYSGSIMTGTRNGNTVSLLDVGDTQVVSYTLTWTSDFEFAGVGRNESLVTGEYVEFDVTGEDIKTSSLSTQGLAGDHEPTIWEPGW